MLHFNIQSLVLIFLCVHYCVIWSNNYELYKKAYSCNWSLNDRLNVFELSKKMPFKAIYDLFPWFCFIVAAVLIFLSISNNLLSTLLSIIFAYITALIFPSRWGIMTHLYWFLILPVAIPVLAILTFFYPGTSAFEINFWIFIAISWITFYLVMIPFMRNLRRDITDSVKNYLLFRSFRSEDITDEELVKFVQEYFPRTATGYILWILSEIRSK